MLETNDENLKIAVKKYFNEVKKIYNSGSRNIETTYNKPIMDLLENFGVQTLDVSGGRAKSKGENIDIELWDSESDINKINPFGAIEVKKIDGIDDRARNQTPTEVKYYENVILTDNCIWEFWQLKNGKVERHTHLILIEKDVSELKLNESKIDFLIQYIKGFILLKPSNIKSSKKLAFYMAEYAKEIRTTVSAILTNEKQKMYNELFSLYQKLKQELLPELNSDAFADMYAQTIVYGLFIARYNDKSLSTFSRGEAIEGLAKESHLLKQFFQHIATSSNLHITLDNAVEKLCELYLITNIPQLLDKNEEKDTILHFYEEFLSFYDKDKRKEFGAFYTPVQVVRYMVQMVDNALINEFFIKGGLSNNAHFDMQIKSDPYQNPRNKSKMLNIKTVSVPQVAILDPACGTGTFSAEIIKYVKEKYFSGINEVFYKKWIQDENSLLSRLIGFEIMMTSYVVAHLKIRRTITETLGCQPDEDLQSNIFLTNTLAEPKSILEKNAQLTFFDFSGAITDEAEQADKWKVRRPIKVIIGNPPYLAASTNPYDISAYKFETDGITKLNERNPKWLNDDYVKFIRFAQQHIEKDGTGILAYISNNGYLDNPTFRGMRASLLRTFDKIYIINLHGNSIKKETTPDGGKDENVFDIRVGVAIIIGIKTSQKSEWAKVYHSDIFGLREDKFNILTGKNINFTELEINKETALLIPQNRDEDYENSISLIDLFNKYSVGVVIGRDRLLVRNNKNEIEKVLKDFKTKDVEELRLQYNLGRDTDWTIKSAKNDIEMQDGSITKIAYRPFDDRWTYYTGKPNGVYCRPRDEVMRNFVSGDNVGFIFARGDTAKTNASAFIVNSIVDNSINTSNSSGVCSVAPLYIKSNNFIKENTPNFNAEHLEKLTQNLSTKPTPQEVFDYCYGVLYDPTYREKYNEFLKRDYPKVPIIKNEKDFKKYVMAGEKLRKLQLMQTDAKIDLTFDGDATDLIIKMVKYSNGKLAINKTTKIVGIPQNVWDYYIGGYKVLDKWFKSHKGEELDLEQFNHIQKVAGILAETIKVQEKLKNGN